MTPLHDACSPASGLLDVRAVLAGVDLRLLHEQVEDLIAVLRRAKGEEQGAAIAP